MTPSSAPRESLAIRHNHSFSLSRAFDAIIYFAVAVYGFSFWFFIAVPFASHRETYWWLAMTGTKAFSSAFGVISVTYRPLAQAATWLAFLSLNPHVFPTSALRQGILQGLVYVCFLGAWYLIYCGAQQRRVFSLLACITGGVFFSGYVHLFHIYGIMYVPVMVMLGLLLNCANRGELAKHEVLLGVTSLTLALWHPFATALFTGFYAGVYIETFPRRNLRRHVIALLILTVNMAFIVCFTLLFARDDAKLSISTRLVGCLISYKTIEVNVLGSLISFALSLIVGFGVQTTARAKTLLLSIIVVAGVLCFIESLPLSLLWICIAILNLLSRRKWSLMSLSVTAALLPFGAAIGAPVFALFAIILATASTAIGLRNIEENLASTRIQVAVAVLITVGVVVIALVRAGQNVPLVTAVGRPLLVEREKTYQLESLLDRLRNSNYCNSEIIFFDSGDSPLDSARSALSREHRPPAAISDVRLFWNTALRCGQRGPLRDSDQTVIIAFGGSRPAGARPILKVEGRLAGDATAWLPKPSPVHASGVEESSR